MDTRRDVFQAIADPTRRAILTLIASQALTPGAIAENFDSSRQTISKHIQILSECELLNQKQTGREIYYYLNPKKMKEVSDWLDPFRQTWETRFDKIDVLIKELKKEKEMNSKTIPANSVIVERTFDAPVEMLWKIWTEPDLIMRWFGGDPNGTVLGAQIDLRVGGKHEVTFMDSNGTNHTAFGEYTLVELHSRLHYSWEWLSEPGFISELEVQFIPIGDKTQLILLHKNLSPDSKHTYEQGWNGALDKVARVVASNNKKSQI